MPWHVTVFYDVLFSTISTPLLTNFVQFLTSLAHPGRQTWQIVELPRKEGEPLCLRYDQEWLAVLRCVRCDPDNPKDPYPPL